MLSYQQIKIELQFIKPVSFDTFPLFIIRSVLGWQLKSMCCLAHGKLCTDCLYNKTCAYVFLFETILDKTNTIQAGRNRASHPYLLSGAIPASVGSVSSSLFFTLTLVGKAIDYLPYMYAALVRAGPCGLFKNRTVFKVSDISIGGSSIIQGTDSLKTDIPAECWNMDNLRFCFGSCVITVQLLSPLRFKSNGKYSDDFDAVAFFQCLERRMHTLCSLYGTVGECEWNAENTTRFSGIEITERNLVWKDEIHYSARQKQPMRLGGVTGSFIMQGHCTPYMQSLLDFARIFGAGKNTNFGLGQMNYKITGEAQ